MIVTNGSTFDKNLTSSDAENLKDKEQATKAADKADETAKVDKKKDHSANPSIPESKAGAKEAPQLSIDTKREQVKAMLEQTVTNSKDLEVVEEEAAGADAQKLEKQVSSP